MMITAVKKERIFEELQELEPTRWFEVLDFIGYLKRRPPLEYVTIQARELTANDLLQSGLVGLWADRQDIPDSVSFARQLRQQAEHRNRQP
ncbi:MAG: hypothetical protein AB1791_17025 [Chloroflexota bacterium]